MRKKCNTASEALSPLFESIFAKVPHHRTLVGFKYTSETQETKNAKSCKTLLRLKFKNVRPTLIRISRLQMFLKIDALKNFPNFTGKHLQWILVLKRDSDTGVFCQICEIFMNTFFTENLQWLLLFNEHDE